MLLSSASREGRYSERRRIRQDAAKDAKMAREETLNISSPTLNRMTIIASVGNSHVRFLKNVN